MWHNVVGSTGQWVTVHNTNARVGKGEIAMAEGGSRRTVIVRHCLHCGSKLELVTGMKPLGPCEECGQASVRLEQVAVASPTDWDDVLYKLAAVTNCHQGCESCKKVVSLVHGKISDFLRVFQKASPDGPEVTVIPEPTQPTCPHQSADLSVCCALACNVADVHQTLSGD